MKLKTLCVSTQGRWLLCRVRDVKATFLRSHHHREFCRGELTPEGRISCVAFKFLLTMLFLSGSLAWVKRGQLKVLWKRLSGQGSQFSKQIRSVVFKTKQKAKLWNTEGSSLTNCLSSPTPAHREGLEGRPRSHLLVLGSWRISLNTKPELAPSWMVYRTSP